jgi:hypothetical protein
MAQYVPRDWPEGVHPPDSEGWEGTAVTWRLIPPGSEPPEPLKHDLQSIRQGSAGFWHPELDRAFKRCRLRLPLVFGRRLLVRSPVPACH